jgi:hypothetical protein
VQPVVPEITIDIGMAILQQVAAGMVFLHNKGITHRCVCSCVRVCVSVSVSVCVCVCVVIWRCGGYVGVWLLCLMKVMWACGCCVL